MTTTGRAALSHPHVRFVDAAGSQRRGALPGPAVSPAGLAYTRSHPEHGGRKALLSITATSLIHAQLSLAARRTDRRSPTFELPFDVALHYRI